MPINGTETAVVGVDPSQFRSFAAAPTGAANALWQGVADGGIAVSYEMGKLDKLPLGGSVRATGRTTKQLPVVAFGTLGIVPPTTVTPMRQRSVAWRTNRQCFWYVA